MGPVWHGGQDIKALVLASRAESAAKALGWKEPFPVSEWLRAAEAGAGFTLRTQEMAGEDMGLIHAFENSCCDVQTSTLLEGMHGLLLLGNETGNTTYIERASLAVEWALKTLMPSEPGLMFDSYNLSSRNFIPLKWNTLTTDRVGRPMADDSMFLRVARLGRPKAPQLRKAFYAVIERLVQTEAPPGNWGGCEYEESPGVMFLQRVELEFRVALTLSMMGHNNITIARMRVPCRCTVLWRERLHAPAAGEP